MNAHRSRGKLPELAFSIGLVLSVATVASAEVHEVKVGDNFYQPFDLTIRPGDTVHWIQDIAAHSHNVVADDSSWQNGEPDWKDWEYERSFDVPGEVRYYCSEHSSPGQTLYDNHNGRILVEEDTPSFLINTGISDAWYDPATDGQGFFIIVWEPSQYVFLSWFTYDTERPPADVIAVMGDPGHRWLPAQGPYEGDSASLDIYVSSGGVFDSADPPAGPPVQDGSIDIVWSGCNAGLLSYDIPSLGLQGEIPIQRIVLDNVAACNAAQPAQ